MTELESLEQLAVKKKCNVCLEYKDINEFYTYKSKNNKIDPLCKDCNSKRSRNYRRTIVGFLSVSYSAKLTSSKKRGHNPPEFTKDEFVAFALGNLKFINLWHNYVRSGYDKNLAPSFDRKDDSIGYSFENFNDWMTWKENNTKGNYCIRSGSLKHGNKPQVAVVQCDMDGNIIKEHVSIHDAGRYSGVDYRTIWAYCNGKCSEAGGFKWKYKHD